MKKSGLYCNGNYQCLLSIAKYNILEKLLSYKERYRYEKRFRIFKKGKKACC